MNQGIRDDPEYFILQLLNLFTVAFLQAALHLSTKLPEWLQER